MLFAFCTIFLIYLFTGTVYLFINNILFNFRDQVAEQLHPQEVYNF